MAVNKGYSRFMPFYFQKRKGIITENTQNIPFVVRYARKTREIIFFALWIYPGTPEKRKKDIIIRWDEVKFNVDLTEIKDKKRILKFKKK